jgi:hypothetical protein
VKDSKQSRRLVNESDTCFIGPEEKFMVRILQQNQQVSDFTSPGDTLKGFDGCRLLPYAQFKIFVLHYKLKNAFE